MYLSANYHTAQKSDFFIVMKFIILVLNDGMKSLYLQ